jgi:hypothetical protein
VHAGRRRGKSRPRILYWFRTPPGVRVGRAALDEDAIRLIEEHNPDVEFDWTRILKGQGAETKPSAPIGRDRYDKSRHRPDSRPQAPPAARAGQPFVPPMPTVEPSDVQDLAAEPVDVDIDQIQDEAEVVAEDLVAVETERSGTDAADAVSLDSTDEIPLTPAHARLGSEGVLRLRARHAEVRARITERIPDPARQDELKTQAERLNPDTWVTDAEVTAGLEEYETVFEALRTAVGGPRRDDRNKRRRGGHHGPPAVEAKTENT